VLLCHDAKADFGSGLQLECRRMGNCHKRPLRRYGSAGNQPDESDKAADCPPTREGRTNSELKMTSFAIQRTLNRSKLAG
jgi:hypothetical protein